jgi:hypothetical protein
VCWRSEHTLRTKHTCAQVGHVLQGVEPGEMEEETSASFTVAVLV